MCISSAQPGREHRGGAPRRPCARLGRTHCRREGPPRSMARAVLGFTKLALRGSRAAVAAHEDAHVASGSEAPMAREAPQAGGTGWCSAPPARRSREARPERPAQDERQLHEEQRRPQLPGAGRGSRAVAGPPHRAARGTRAPRVRRRQGRCARIREHVAAPTALRHEMATVLAACSGAQLQSCGDCSSPHRRARASGGGSLCWLLGKEEESERH